MLKRLAIVVACALVAILYVWLASKASARWKAEYANNPPEVQQWFKSRRNSAGQWCCSEADGHPYYGDYTLNPDGSVTVEGETIEKEKVLTEPNPTGSAVWWYIENANGRHTYCFAIGSGT